MPLTLEEIKALVEEQGTLWKHYRETHDRLLAEGKDTQKEWTETLQAMNTRLDELDVKLARPHMPGPESKTGDGPSEHHQLFLKMCRKGPESLTPDESKALTAGDDTTGGYLASPEIDRELIKGVVEFSPLRSVARVRTTSQRSIKVRKRTGTFAAQWRSETGTKTETAGLKYGVEELHAHELYALVPVSVEDLEDSDFNLEAELNMEFAEQFGVAEGAAFISGTAVGKPEGILTNAAIASVNSGNASLITADGLIDLFFTLKDAYAKNAWWVLRRATIGAVRKLKDGNGQYLWQPGLAGLAPSQILDRPYLEAVDMPDVAAGAFSIAFGDFRRGYVIVDRTSVRVLRDPFSAKKTGMIEFDATKRVGGQVVNAEAIKKLKIAA